MHVLITFVGLGGNTLVAVCLFLGTAIITS